LPIKRAGIDLTSIGIGLKRTIHHPPGNAFAQEGIAKAPERDRNQITGAPIERKIIALPRRFSAA
jgi:hypothetical protein